jgi:hypothetical protein
MNYSIHPLSSVATQHEEARAREHQEHTRPKFNVMAGLYSSLYTTISGAQLLRNRNKSTYSPPHYTSRRNMLYPWPIKCSNQTIWAFQLLRNQNKPSFLSPMAAGRHERCVTRIEAAQARIRISCVSMKGHATIH